MARPPHYQAYLLRLWQDNPTTGWRASLQAPGASPLRSFADLQMLIAFLLDLTNSPHQAQKETANARYSSLNQAEKQAPNARRVDKNSDGTTN